MSALTWTDAEVRDLIDVVMIARDVELADRLFNVISTDGYHTPLKALGSKPVAIWKGHPAGRLVRQEVVALASALRHFRPDGTGRDSVKLVTGRLGAKVRRMHADYLKSLDVRLGAGVEPAAPVGPLRRGKRGTKG